jgi:ABC-type dipeptide/oligopeptide/nickel transport system ATPase subunit
LGFHTEGGESVSKSDAVPEPRVTTPSGAVLPACGAGGSGKATVGATDAAAASPIARSGSVAPRGEGGTAV